MSLFDSMNNFLDQEPARHGDMIELGTWLADGVAHRLRLCVPTGEVIALRGPSLHQPVELLAVAEDADAARLRELLELDGPDRQRDLAWARGRLRLTFGHPPAQSD